MDLNRLKYKPTGKRKEQLKKILKYGKEILNLDIQLKPANEMGNDAGGYIHPQCGDKGIVIVRDDYRALPLISVLLHEFGHHIDFLNRGWTSEDHDAYDYYPESAEDVPIPTKYKKIIKFIEDEAIRYSKELALYLDLRLPEFYIIKDNIYDNLVLETLFEKGFTTHKDRATIRRLAHEKAKEILNEQRKDS